MNYTAPRPPKILAEMVEYRKKQTEDYSDCKGRDPNTLVVSCTHYSGLFRRSVLLISVSFVRFIDCYEQTLFASPNDSNEWPVP